MSSIFGEFPNSSNLASYLYDTETQALTITFRSGGRYSYAGVPRDLLQGMIEADSAGKFFASNIRSAYSYTKLEGAH